MATAEYSMWVTKRYPTLGNRVGFVMVPANLRAGLIADGGAQDTFDYRSTISPAPPITALTFTPVGVATDAPIGTNAGTLAATGGTTPYTFSLAQNDGGNFTVEGNTVKTAKTPLTAGAHQIVTRVVDDGGRQLLKAGTVTVTAPGALAARKTVAKK